jgi:hypothetical protein
MVESIEGEKQPQRKHMEGVMIMGSTQDLNKGTFSMQKQVGEDVHIPDEQVREKAREIAQRLEIHGFEASKGWLRKFKVRVGGGTAGDEDFDDEEGDYDDEDEHMEGDDEVCV